MAQDPGNLIWIDMEMSGLDPERERILEIAIVITNSALETVAEAPVLVVHQPQSLLDGMDNGTARPTASRGWWTGSNRRH